VLTRIFSVLLLIGSAVFAQLPLANFTGAVHGVSKNQITLETPEGNLLDFEINKKTRVLRGKKEVRVEALRTGDPVTIEAKQEMAQYLVAVIITASEPLKN